MPGWWDKLLSQLKHFNPIKVNAKVGDLDLSHLGDRRVYNIHITVNPSLPPLSQTGDGPPVLNLAAITPQQQQQLLELLKEAVTQDDALILERNSAETVKQVQHEESADSREIVEVLRPLVPPTDLLILRASLHLRQRYRAGDRAAAIARIKYQIITRFGERGRKIANLCTAGYIDDPIVTLAKEVNRDPKFDQKAFLERYELLVNESAFAVFVPNATSEAQIEQLINNRIKANHRYGLKYAPIHGIGSPNIERIPKCAVEMAAKAKGLQVAELKTAGRSVYVRLEFSEEFGSGLTKD